jgi:predicted nucleic acid-binding protein
MNYLLDTTAYSELLRGHDGTADLVQRAGTLYLPNVVMAELRYGFALGGRQEENERLLERFVASKKVRVLLPDNATTTYFVAIAVYAKHKGIKLSTHDVWIAALCEQWEAALVTFDRDFTHLAYPKLQLAKL